MPLIEEPILTMRDQICDAIRGEIIAGKLTQNQPIREQTFASRFGVSRNSVRDAFLQLSQEGILFYSPNRGVRPGNNPNFMILSRFWYPGTGPWALEAAGRQPTILIPGGSGGAEPP